MSERESQSGSRSSEVERIIATAEVDTKFVGKTARYRGRRSVRYVACYLFVGGRIVYVTGAFALFLITTGSVFGVVYYDIQLKDNVNTAGASDAAARQYSSGTPILDGRPAAADPDISVMNPKSYTDNKCQQPSYVRKCGKIVAVFAVVEHRTAYGSLEAELVVLQVRWLLGERMQHWEHLCLVEFDREVQEHTIAHQRADAPIEHESRRLAFVLAVERVDRVRVSGHEPVTTSQSVRLINAALLRPYFRVVRALCSINLH